MLRLKAKAAVTTGAGDANSGLFIMLELYQLNHRPSPQDFYWVQPLTINCLSQGYYCYNETP